MENSFMKVGEIAEIKNGFFFIGSGVQCRSVAIAYPLMVDNKTIERELGKDLKYTSPENMLKNLKMHIAPFKTYEIIFICPNKKKEKPKEKGNELKEEDKEKERKEIFGITSRHPITEKITARRIGFYNPKEVERGYKEMLAEEGQPEEVPYYKYYNLGEEWEGTAITKGEHEIRLTGVSALVKSFKVGFIFEQR